MWQLDNLLNNVQPHWRVALTSWSNLVRVSLSLRPCRWLTGSREAFCCFSTFNWNKWEVFFFFFYFSSPKTRLQAILFLTLAALRRSCKRSARLSFNCWDSEVCWNLDEAPTKEIVTDFTVIFTQSHNPSIVLLLLKDVITSSSLKKYIIQVQG